MPPCPRCVELHQELETRNEEIRALKGELQELKVKYNHVISRQSDCSSQSDHSEHPNLASTTTTLTDAAASSPYSAYEEPLSLSQDLTKQDQDLEELLGIKGATANGNHNYSNSGVASAEAFNSPRLSSFFKAGGTVENRPQSDFGSFSTCTQSNNVHTETTTTTTTTTSTQEQPTCNVGRDATDLLQFGGTVEHCVPSSSPSSSSNISVVVSSNNDDNDIMSDVFGPIPSSAQPTRPTVTTTTTSSSTAESPSPSPSSSSQHHPSLIPVTGPAVGIRPSSNTTTQQQQQHSDSFAHPMFNRSLQECNHSSTGSSSSGSSTGSGNMAELTAELQALQQELARIQDKKRGDPPTTSVPPGIARGMTQAELADEALARKLQLEEQQIAQQPIVSHSGPSPQEREDAKLALMLQEQENAMAKKGSSGNEQGQEGENGNNNNNNNNSGGGEQESSALTTPLNHNSSPRVDLPPPMIPPPPNPPPPDTRDLASVNPDYESVTNQVDGSAPTVVSMGGGGSVLTLPPRLPTENNEQPTDLSVRLPSSSSNSSNNLSSLNESMNNPSNMSTSNLSSGYHNNASWDINNLGGQYVPPCARLDSIVPKVVYSNSLVGTNNNESTSSFSSPSSGAPAARPDPNIQVGSNNINNDSYSQPQFSFPGITGSYDQALQWTPLNSQQRCMGCHSKFGLITKRNHCRACGQVMCGSCVKMRSTVDGFVHRTCLLCSHLHPEELTRRVRILSELGPPALH